MITFINVFTVVPDKQQAAFKAIQKVYTEVVKHQPGFIEAKLLVSDDGTRVSAIACWDSVENLAQMRQNQDFQDLHNAEFFSNIVSNDLHVYSTVVEVQAHK
jgi:heme-degrading monooxygenase HmoA